MAVAHAQTERPEVRPRLLLSNCCHVEYFNLAPSSSFPTELFKLRVFIVHEAGNLRSELTSVDELIVTNTR